MKIYRENSKIQKFMKTESYNAHLKITQIIDTKIQGADYPTTCDLYFEIFRALGFSSVHYPPINDAPNLLMVATRETIK